MKLRQLLHHVCLDEILGRLHLPHSSPPGLHKFHSHYQLGGLLGKGGFASVYQATKVSDGTRVAVKMVAKSSIAHMEGSAPLEVALLHQVSDIPGVAHILQHYDLGHSFALVLETSPHTKDLFDLIEERGHLDEQFSRKVFSQGHGVLHRDIKDENILVSEDTLQVKLIDFGSGCHLRSGEEEFHRFEGTPIYAPPEWVGEHKYRGEGLSVWELGVLLYSMLCGSLPFHTSKQILGAHIQWGTKVSDSARDLVTSCLTRDPRLRIHLKDILSHPWFHLEENRVEMEEQGQVEKEEKEEQGQVEKKEKEEKKTENMDLGNFEKHEGSFDYLKQNAKKQEEDDNDKTNEEPWNLSPELMRQALVEDMV